MSSDLKPKARPIALPVSKASRSPHHGVGSKPIVRPPAGCTHTPIHLMLAQEPRRVEGIVPSYKVITDSCTPISALNPPPPAVHQKGVPMSNMKENNTVSGSAVSPAPYQQVNPYPASIDALIAEMQPPAGTNMGQYMPPPVYSKAQPVAGQNCRADTIDRKNLRDLAYQQLCAPYPQQMMQPPAQYYPPPQYQCYPPMPMPQPQFQPSQQPPVYYAAPQNFAAPSTNPAHGGAVDEAEFKSPVPSSNPKEKQSHKQKYKPYTLRDYKEIKPEKYSALGGLGANVGGDKWQLQRGKLDRMTEYAKGAKKFNRERMTGFSKRLSAPSKVIMPEVEEAIKRKRRMMDYAKQIPRPKRTVEGTPFSEGGAVDIREDEENDAAIREPLTELEKLEMQHNEYMDQIGRMKAKIN